MKKLRNFTRSDSYEEKPIDWFDDTVERVSSAMVTAGYECPPAVAFLLWKLHSYDSAAGFLAAPPDSEIVSALKGYFEK